MNLKSFSLFCRNVLIFLALLLAVNSFAQRQLYTASYFDFDEVAKSARPVSVVFFGGSSVLGDGTSEPEPSSYRALMKNYLRHKYPKAKFAFYDVAVGDTGSKLGMFRVGDVLARRPHLVFLDFTIEDNLKGTDRQTLASYESILRDLIVKGVPVVQMLLGSKNHFGEDWKHLGTPRHRDHRELGKLYHLAIADTLPPLQNRLENGVQSKESIWPEDETKANDVGHQIFFDVARQALEEAIQEKRSCNLPLDAVFAHEYAARFQIYPARTPLPQGWMVEKSSRPAIDLVANGNKWPNETAVCRAEEVETALPLRIDFHGTFVALLGEADEHGLGFKVLIDGRAVPFTRRPYDLVWPTSTARINGGEHLFWHEISDELKPGRHVIELQPIRNSGDTIGELRIGSICVAGSATALPQRVAAGKDNQ